MYLLWTLSLNAKLQYSSHVTGSYRKLHIESRITYLLVFSMKFWLQVNIVEIVEVEKATYFNKQKREWLTFI